MRSKYTFLLLALLIGCMTTGFSQEPEKLSTIAPNAPADKPQPVKSAEQKALDEAIKPYVEKARKTYPEAKKRFLAGLPPKHVFFVTTRLHDDGGHWEQVFIEVKEIKDGVIKGLIASDIETVSGYKAGDKYSLPETELMDWTVSKPDGTEEGNFVGNFLDTYKPD
ncbi:MAG: hypothetical protein JWM21_2384 [Acidobacteria bacterium]|nr:hypothetical protein [Acidobacteriota bacterium]